MNHIIVRNFLWRLAERFGAQIVTFIVSIILARVLDPTTYGLIALVNVFTVFFGIFVDSGLGTSLVQKKDADDLDFSSVFYFNVVISIIVYIVLFIISPFIASFYNNELLTSIIRVISITLLISGVKNIQVSYVSRHLLFKNYFFSTLIGTLVAAVVGIWMAYNGYGVWALVVQNLVNNLVDTIILWFTVKWKPKLLFSFSRLKVLLTYGWKLLVSSMLDSIWSQLRQLIIGKKYAYEDLAFYNKGNNLPQISAVSLLTAVDSVLFPTLSKVQDKKEKVRELTRKAITVGSYFLWPMMIGLAACSDNFILLLLTEKWIPAIPYLRIFCITYAFYPIHTSNLNAIKAIGRSDIFLKLEIIKKIMGLSIILISVQYGVYAMALSTIVSSILSQIINSYPNKKLLNYSYIEQLKDLFPSLVMSIIMGAVVYSINYLGFNYAVTFIVQVLTGVLVYVVLSILTKNESFKFCLDAVSSFFKKK